MKIGRNDPCSCGSGKKFKKCCGNEAYVELPKNVLGGVHCELPEKIYHMSPFEFSKFKAPEPEIGKDVDVGFHFYIDKAARHGVGIYLAQHKGLKSDSFVYTYEVTPKWKHKKLFEVSDQGLPGTLKNSYGETWDTCNIIAKVFKGLGIGLKDGRLAYFSQTHKNYMEKNNDFLYAVLDGSRFIDQWNARFFKKEPKLSTDEQLLWLAQWMDRLGFDGVCYENIHEKGGKSIVLFDEKLIHISNVTSKSLGDVLFED